MGLQSTSRRVTQRAREGVAMTYKLSDEAQLRIKKFRSDHLPAESAGEFISIVLDVAEELAIKMYREMQVERKRVIDANLRTLLR